MEQPPLELTHMIETTISLEHGHLNLSTLDVTKCINQYGLPMDNIIKLLRTLTIANNFIEMNRHDDAIRMYQRLILEYPHIEDLWFNIGAVQYQKGDIETAVQTYKETVRMFPKSFMVIYNLACCLFELGDYEDALHHFIQASRCPAPLFHLKKFIKLLRSCIVQNIRSYYTLGQIHYAWRQYDRAAIVYQIGLQLFTDETFLHAKMYFELGVYHYSQSEFRKASHMFLQSVKINPDKNELNRNAYQYSIRLLSHLKEYDLGYSITTIYFKIYRYTRDMIYFHALFSYHKQEYDSAINLMLYFVDTPHNIDENILLMTSYLQQDHYEIACRYAFDLEPLYPDMTQAQKKIYANNAVILMRKAGLPIDRFIALLID